MSTADRGAVVEAPDGARILIHAFPNEEGLVGDVRRVALAVAPSARSEDDLRQQVEDGLRAWYPRIRIRLRDPLATFTENELVWYVLRDGLIHRKSDRLDRLHAALADARATAAVSDAVMERAQVMLGKASRGRPARDAASALPRARGTEAPEKES